MIILGSSDSSPVYVPHPERSCLVDQNGGAGLLDLSPNFFLAAKSRAPDPWEVNTEDNYDIDVYQALRVVEPVEVVDIIYPDRIDGVDSSIPIELPAGSLLLYLLTPGYEHRRWMALNPDAEVKFEVERRQIDGMMSGITLYSPETSIKTRINRDDAELFLSCGYWSNERQRQAHIRDLDLIDHLGLNVA